MFYSSSRNSSGQLQLSIFLFNGKQNSKGCHKGGMIDKTNVNEASLRALWHAISFGFCCNRVYFAHLLANCHLSVVARVDPGCRSAGPECGYRITADRSKEGSNSGGHCFFVFEIQQIILDHLFSDVP